MLADETSLLIQHGKLNEDRESFRSTVTDRDIVDIFISHLIKLIGQADINPKNLKVIFSFELRNFDLVTETKTLSSTLVNLLRLFLAFKLKIGSKAG